MAAGGSVAIVSRAISDFAAKRLYRTAQGFNPGSEWLEKVLCLSAVVLGRWDEGGKVAPDLGARGNHTRPAQRHCLGPISSFVAPS